MQTREEKEINCQIVRKIDNLKINNIFAAEREFSNWIFDIIREKENTGILPQDLIQEAAEYFVNHYSYFESIEIAIQNINDTIRNAL